MILTKVFKKRERGYTNLANNIIDDQSMSYKAIGIFVCMWRKPDGWDFNIQTIAKEHKDGKKAVSSGIDELIEHGYVERRANRNHGRFGGYDYILHEIPKPQHEENHSPQPQKGDTVSPKPQKGDTEKPYTENPYTEKDTQVNTIYNNYYLTNKTTTTNNLIKSKLKANGILPNESTVAMVSEFLQTMEMKAVFYAIEKTGKAARPSANYLEAILRSNQKHQILTYEQALAADKKRQQYSPSLPEAEPSGQQIPIFKLEGVLANE